MPLKGWKSAAFGLLIALIAVFSSAEMQSFVAEYLPWIGGILGALVVFLRALTSSPIFKKE